MTFCHGLTVSFWAFCTRTTSSMETFTKGYVCQFYRSDSTIFRV
jgi:hypothetical protein